MTENYTVPIRKVKTMPMEGMTVKSGNLRTAMVVEFQDDSSWGVWIRAP